MKKLLQNLLASLSRSILKKYRPVIIGITGSVGKTSAKEAVFHVVSQKFSTRRSEKNFNNEFGLPLTIIGAGAPGRNPILWLELMLKACGLLMVKKSYPEVLILEMGVDRPGDMDYLVSIAHPDIAIITTIGISHYEFFENPEAIEKEKGKVAEALSKEGTLIVNADNPAALKQQSKTRVQTLSYGTNSNAQILVSEISGNFANFSTNFLIKTPSRSFTASIHAVGETHTSAASAAIAVGEALKIETDLILKGLLEYKPIPGRQNVLSGIKHSVIIDDTYNASPDSTTTALNLLSHTPKNYKMAILGDMLELGNISQQEHENIGKLTAELNIQKLVTVGAGGKIIADGAIKAGMDREHIISFDSSSDALNAVQNMLVPDSAVLIKGSQGVRMEKITKEIMAEPMRAEELLCRQYGKWLSN